MKTFRYASIIPALDGDDFVFARHADFMFGRNGGTDTTVQDTASGPGLYGKDADQPEVLPALADDDFVLGKEADVPLVLPGVDEFDVELLGFDLSTQTFQLPDHMMTLGEDGSLLGPTDDLGRLHDHDGWLF